MLPCLPRRHRELALRWHHRQAVRKIRIIESLDLPEDLRLAAIRRVQRRLEEELSRYADPC